MIEMPAEDDEQDWYEEPRDKLPASESQRQATLLALIKKLGPKCIAWAVPNGGKQSDWARIQGWKTGTVRGALDVTIVWPGGCAFIEVKSGTGSLGPGQCDMLQALRRADHNCAVFRRPESAIDWLRSIGAPIRAAR